MMLLGITGGIGMGKSTAARLLEQAGVAVVDTDVLARQVVEPGEPALDEIRQAFGAQIIGADGRLRRDVVAGLVFRDLVARRRLEEILHPRIRARWQASARQWQESGRPLGAVVIPLLFETGADPQFDLTVCVACSAATRRERVGDRGWSESELEDRLRTQWPVEKKMARADFVVWTEGPEDAHRWQWERILGFELPQLLG